jgi:ribose-phosphate pyrophosphokinase
MRPGRSWKRGQARRGLRHPRGVQRSAIQRIEESPLDEVVVTNSIPAARMASGLQNQYLSIARLLAEAIRRIDANDSVSSLFV